MYEFLKLLAAAAIALPYFVLGQALLKFVVEPIQDQRRLKGKVAHALHYYANVGGRPMYQSGTPESDAEHQRRIDAMKALRNLASELRQSRFVIPFYSTLSRWWPNLILPEDDLEAAATAITGWSNGVVSGSGSQDRRQEIARLLNVTLHPRPKAETSQRSTEVPQTQPPQ